MYQLEKMPQNASMLLNILKLNYITGVDLSKILGRQTKILGCMQKVVSQLLGARARTAPKVYAYALYVYIHFYMNIIIGQILHRVAFYNDVWLAISYNPISLVRLMASCCRRYCYLAS